MLNMYNMFNMLNMFYAGRYENIIKIINVKMQISSIEYITEWTYMEFIGASVSFHLFRCIAVENIIWSFLEKLKKLNVLCNKMYVLLRFM